MLMLLNYLETLIQKLKCRIKYNEAVEELKNLSDRQLRDMGIARCDIYQVARGEHCA